MMVLPAPASSASRKRAHAGELEEVPVDRFELVRQRVHARDGKPETGIELVGDAERIGLETEAQKPPVAVVGKSGVGDGQTRDVIRSQRNPAELLRLLPD